MKKYEKEILQAQLDNEKKVLNDLKESYDDALAQINGKIAQLLGRQDADLPHVIYQVEYQKMLKTQVQAILETLQANEFQTVSEYLTASYNEGFIASQYAMQCQGVPLIFPINQEQVVQAVQHETKLSAPLYTELGKDIKDLSKKIAGEISRGISSGQGYGEIARNLSSYANIPLNNAMRIARTESHRIQCKSAYDAQVKAKSKGADVLKEWNAYLDGKTRPHHRKLNGQIRELDEPFEIAGFKPMYPGNFNDPAEDCNCRCALLQRARWELDDEETQYLGDTSSMTDEQREEIAAKLGIPVDELDNYSESIVPLHATSLDDFRDKYNNIWHYEGSEEQKINLANAEQTRESILSQRVRSNAQKMNDAEVAEWNALRKKYNSQEEVMLFGTQEEMERYKYLVDTYNLQAVNIKEEMSVLYLPDFDNMTHDDIVKWANENLKTTFEDIKGVNHDFYKETVKTLAEFETRMNGNTIDGLSVKYGAINGTYAKYDDVTNTLLLRRTGNIQSFEEAREEENIRYRVRWHSDRDYHATTSYRGTVFHELGHAVDADTGQALSRALSSNNLLDEASVKISVYAGSTQGIRVTRRSEAWAENFAAYMEGGPKADEVPGAIVNMIENYFNSTSKTVENIVNSSTMESGNLPYDLQLFAIGSKGFPTITLPKDEYAMVMSELNTHMSDLQRSQSVVTKPIGNYIYTIENNGFDDYRIIGKEPIDSDAVELSEDL